MTGGRDDLTFDIATDDGRMAFLEYGIEGGVIPAAVRLDPAMAGLTIRVGPGAIHASPRAHAALIAYLDLRSRGGRP
jgi:hypothetical protein